jgi:asparagine synthase (glutamine-hydrolysing)
VFRYVAFVWDDADLAARASAGRLSDLLRADLPKGDRPSAGESRWNTVLDGKGLRVFCAGVREGSSEAYTLRNGGGVILGKLFERGQGAPSRAAPLSPGEEESRRIVASRGRRLIDSYWGRYVAFVHEDEARVTRVIVDPSATLPCLSTRLADVHVYFSSMEDVLPLRSDAFSINWKYVAAVLCHWRLNVHTTGLSEVERVLGGECVEHSAGRATRSVYWSPLDFAQSDVIEDAEEAASAIRETTRDCVHAWASSYSSILHFLSGGLDSSIVLACLRDAPTRPKITCVNFHSPGAHSDEREYARLVARDAGYELLERERDSALSLESLLRIRRSAVPRDYFVFLDEGRYEAEIAREHGATALFTGYGGDQIFFQSRAAHAAGDFLTRHGLSAALLEVALDAARVDRLSIWSVLGKAFAAAWFGKRWSPYQERFVPHSIIPDRIVQDISRDSDLVPPMLRSPSGAPNGKRFHAYGTMFPAEFYHPLASETHPEQVSPLFSQPLLEVAMRIPTWLLTRGGWDRAMARRAFQHDMPQRIVVRRTKGGREGHSKALLLRNMDFVRSLLLDGNLVRQRILERRQVAEILAPGPGRLRSGNVELHECLSAEAWVRQWATS